MAIIAILLWSLLLYESIKYNINLKNRRYEINKQNIKNHKSNI